jgi:hypothetical protein
MLGKVQGHNSGCSELYCNFLGLELNTYAEAFEVSMKRF